MAQSSAWLITACFERRKNDLGEIADYTFAKHGVQQAKVYRDGLLKSFDAIAEHPEIGTDQS